MTKSSTSKKTRPVETCPSFRSGHLPHLEDVERLRDLSAPHVESFNYLLDTGLTRGINDIEPSELCLVDPNKLRPSSTEVIDWHDATSVQFWIEDVRVGFPVKADTTEAKNQLYPRECRERGLMYGGPLTGTFCYTIIERRNGVEFPGKPVRLPKRQFGNMPVVVMSKACHLQGLAPNELVKLKEEVGLCLNSFERRIVPSAK
jgi:DNA-directed RNA polymerase I subunit RPA2